MLVVVAVVADGVVVTGRVDVVVVVLGVNVTEDFKHY